MPAVNTQETCHYCQGNCPNEPEDSEYLCDGFAGDIDNLYASSALKQAETETDYELNDNYNSCWVTVGNISVYVRRTTDGVSVELLPRYKEDKSPISSAYATFADASEDN